MQINISDDSKNKVSVVVICTPHSYSQVHFKFKATFNMKPREDVNANFPYPPVVQFRGSVVIQKYSETFIYKTVTLFRTKSQIVLNVER